MLFFSDILKSLSLHLQLFSAVPWIICTLQSGIYKAATRSNIWISTSFEASFFYESIWFDNAIIADTLIKNPLIREGFVVY